MRCAVLVIILGAIGCQPEMSDMMEDGPMDAGEADARVGMPDGMVPPDPNPLRINHMQLRATTNSYHQQDTEEDPELFAYTHLPLAEQAAEQGIRFFDFDLWPDRESALTLYPRATDHPADNAAICPSWFWCLREFEPWVEANEDQALVVFLVGEAYLFATTPGLHVQLDVLEDVILDTLGRERVLKPADVRGAHPTLRDAIRADGWPTVQATRGKFMFVLNDRSLARERYIERGGLDPDERLLFIVGDPDRAEDPETGDEVVFAFEPEFDGDPWYYDTDPADLERMQALSAAGFLVYGTSDDPEMIADLRAAGAHAVGTRFPDLFGEIPPSGPVECNPITRPGGCDPADFQPRR